MKIFKYILVLSATILVFAACEKKESEPEKWPETITTEYGTFVLVNTNTKGFTMGSANIASAAPEHTVKLSKSYYMCTTEVTQAQWVKILGTNPSDNEGIIKEGTNPDNCPVNNISIDDAKAFVEALNAATGRKFAIPTEAQWEWAAMGGVKSNGYAYSGSNKLSEVAWTASNSEDYLNEVGLLTANELGIYDMTGNVQEWTADKFSKYTAAEVTDPKGSTSGSKYAVRGGNFGDPDDLGILSVKARLEIKGTEKSYVRGLRLILTEPLQSELVQ
jgi:formylglycine-generating enzyme required for sulfatase activity